MKKLMKFIAVTLSAAAAVACAMQEEISVQPFEQCGMTFRAVFEPQTRTGVSAEGKVSWQAGDEISVLDGKSNVRVTLGAADISADGSMAVFTASVAAASTYYAVYPYSPYNAIVSGKPRAAALSSSQDGTFASAHICIGSTPSSSTTFTFSNTTGIICFDIDDTNVASVTFEAGTLSVSASLSGEGPYYIGMTPQEFTDGFTVKTFTSDGEEYGSVTSTRSLKVERSAIVNLGCLDARIVKPDPAAYILGLSEMGVYDCNASKAILAFDREEDQSGVLSSGAFRIINPNDALWFEISGLPSSMEAGDEFTATVHNSYKVSLSADYQPTLSVRKVEEGMVWLYSAADGLGYIIKQ